MYHCDDDAQGSRYNLVVIKVKHCRLQMADSDLTSYLSCLAVSCKLRCAVWLPLRGLGSVFPHKCESMSCAQAQAAEAVLNVRGHRLLQGTSPMVQVMLKSTRGNSWKVLFHHLHSLVLCPAFRRASFVGLEKPPLFKVKRTIAWRLHCRGQAHASPQLEPADTEANCQEFTLCYDSSQCVQVSDT